MEYTKVILEKQGAIGKITMNSLANLNALDEALITEILDALMVLDKDEDVRAIVLTGNGKAFSSGGDIRAMKQAVEEGGSDKFFRPTIFKISQLAMAIRWTKKPVIAGMNGVAAGAGANLALLCDFRVATEKASFIEAFINIGLVPDMGGTYLMTKALGYAKATELLMLGTPLTSQEALSFGLVNQVVPVEEFPAALDKFAAKVASMPTRSIGRIKNLVNRAVFAEFESDLQNEWEYQMQSGSEHDFLEGINAFLEKRKPQFTGKP